MSQQKQAKKKAEDFSQTLRTPNSGTHSRN